MLAAKLIVEHRLLLMVNEETDAPRETEERGTFIRSKYSGICRTCGRPYEVGQSVFWVRGKGTKHAECASHH